MVSEHQTRKSPEKMEEESSSSASDEEDDGVEGFFLAEAEEDNTMPSDDSSEIESAEESDEDVKHTWYGSSTNCKISSHEDSPSEDEQQNKVKIGFKRRFNGVDERRPSKRLRVEDSSDASESEKQPKSVAISDKVEIIDSKLPSLKENVPPRRLPRAKTAPEVKHSIDLAFEQFTPEYRALQISKYQVKYRDPNLNRFKSIVHRHRNTLKLIKACRDSLFTVIPKK